MAHVLPGRKAIAAGHAKRKAKGNNDASDNDDANLYEADAGAEEGSSRAAAGPSRSSPRLQRLKKIAEEARDAIAAASSHEAEADARRTRAARRDIDDAA